MKQGIVTGVDDLVVDGVAYRPGDMVEASGKKFARLVERGWVVEVQGGDESPADDSQEDN